MMRPAGGGDMLDASTPWATYPRPPFPTEDYTMSGRQTATDPRAERATARAKATDEASAEHADREVHDPAPAPERDSLEDVAQRLAVLERHIL